MYGTAGARSGREPAGSGKIARVGAPPVAVAGEVAVAVAVAKSASASATATATALALAVQFRTRLDCEVVLIESGGGATVSVRAYTHLRIRNMETAVE